MRTDVAHGIAGVCLLILPTCTESPKARQNASGGDAALAETFGGFSGDTAGIFSGGAGGALGGGSPSLGAGGFGTGGQSIADGVGGFSGAHADGGRNCCGGGSGGTSGGGTGGHLDEDAGPEFVEGGASRDDAGRWPFPPFETSGEPLPGTQGSWTYTEFSNTRCRDGSPSGVSINLGTSNKVMVFLEGGGVCVDESTCAINANNRDNLFAVSLWAIVAAGEGVFARDNPENPVRDWNFAYVHYCSGDRWGGANPSANVPGVGPQTFVGYLNMQRFLDRIVPTFTDATDVLLTGVSAGGFGVAQTSVLVQRAFPNVKVKSINDSGPMMSKDVLAPCMQARSRTLFKLDETFLSDCGQHCPNEDDYWQDFGVFVAKTFNDRPSGLIVSAEDAVERAFAGVSTQGCTGALDLIDPAISGAAFRADMLAFRERIAPYENFSTFFPDSEAHSWLMFDTFYTISAGGVRLVDWFTSIVNGESPGHAGGEP